MKINAFSPDSSFNSSLPAMEKTPKISFKDLIQDISIRTDFGFDNSLKHINKIQQSLINSKNLEPKQILQYQIQISELNLRVELMSKAAESAAALARKMQNSQ